MDLHHRPRRRPGSQRRAGSLSAQLLPLTCPALHPHAARQARPRPHGGRRERSNRGLETALRAASGYPPAPPPSPTTKERRAPAQPAPRTDKKRQPWQELSPSHRRGLPNFGTGAPPHSGGSLARQLHGF
jgi:hypothetical protein